MTSEATPGLRTPAATVIRFRYDDGLGVVLDAHPDVFGTAQRDPV